MKHNTSFKKAALLAVMAIWLCYPSIQAVQAQETTQGTTQTYDKSRKPFRLFMGIYTGRSFGGQSSFGGQGSFGGQPSFGEQGSFEAQGPLDPRQRDIGIDRRTNAFSDATGWNVFWIEPQYYMPDRPISISLRYELARLTPGSADLVRGLRRDDFDASSYHIASLQGDYFLVDLYPFRVSAGMGVGFYYQGAVKGTVEGAVDERTTKIANAQSSFGLAPRVRIQFIPFELGMAYHYTFASEVYNAFTLGIGWQIYSYYPGKYKRHNK